MSTSSRSAERFKYGICLNDECPECKAKKVHQIPMRKDLVCPECGKPLRECPPPNQGGNKKLIAIVVGVVVVLGIGGCIFALSGGDDGTTTPPQGLGPDTTIVEKVDSDSIKAAQLAAAEAAKLQAEQEAKKKPEEVKKPQPSTGGSSKNLGYATFKGSWPNDVNGRMIFKSSHVIDSKDPKGRVAEAGDYVIGEWADGHLVQGIWYGADNQVKGSVIIGR
jgi:hypothetical protein